MIRNQLEREVVSRRIRYLESQLAVLEFDGDDETTKRRRAQLSAELDRSRAELAQYVSGVGALR